MLILIREEGVWEDHGHSVKSRKSGEKLFIHLKAAYGRDNVRIVSVKQWREISLKQEQDLDMEEAKRRDADTRIAQRREAEAHAKLDRELHPPKDELREKRFEYFKKKFTNRKRKREDHDDS